MRITTKELHRNMLDVINKRFSDLANLQEQLASGQRLRRPSDDPVDVANDLQLKTRQREISQHKKNIEDALSYMSITETSINSTNVLLQRIRELSIQGASDTLSEKERFFLNKEVEQLTRQLVALVNTKYKGDYIFNGQQTKIPPLTIEHSQESTLDDYNSLRMAYFNAGGAPVGSSVQIFYGTTDNPVTNMIPGTFSLSVAGVEYEENTDYSIDYENGTLTIVNPALAIDVTPGTPSYDINQVHIRFDSIERGRDIFGQVVSNRGIIERDIESGISMPINVGMDEMTIEQTSGISLFESLVRFGQALIQNDHTGIETAVGEIDTVFSVVLSAQSKNGARMNRLQTTLERNENQYTQITSLQSGLEDAEMAETISQFMLTQNVYNAALQTTAKIIQPSLVNFL